MSCKNTVSSFKAFTFDYYMICYVVARFKRRQFSIVDMCADLVGLMLDALDR